MESSRFINRQSANTKNDSKQAGQNSQKSQRTRQSHEQPQTSATRQALVRQNKPKYRECWLI